MAALSEEHGGDVCFVELAPLADPERVAASVHAALGRRECPGQSIATCDAVRHGQQRGLILLCLSIVAMAEGRTAEGRMQCEASLRRLHENGAVVALPAALSGWRLAHWRRTGTWQRGGSQQPLVSVRRTIFRHRRGGAADDADLAELSRRALGTPLFEAGRGVGTAMDLDQIIARALPG